MAVLHHPKWGYLVQAPSTKGPSIWSPRLDAAMHADALTFSRVARKYWSPMIISAMEIRIEKGLEHYHAKSCDNHM